jgi:hypothetical protein
MKTKEELRSITLYQTGISLSFNANCICTLMNMTEHFKKIFSKTERAKWISNSLLKKVDLKTTGMLHNSLRESMKGTGKKLNTRSVSSFSLIHNLWPQGKLFSDFLLCTS